MHNKINSSYLLSHKAAGIACPLIAAWQARRHFGNMAKNEQTHVNRFLTETGFQNPGGNQICRFFQQELPLGESCHLLKSPTMTIETEGTAYAPPPLKGAVQSDSLERIEIPQAGRGLSALNGQGLQQAEMVRVCNMVRTNAADQFCME